MYASDDQIQHKQQLQKKINFYLAELSLFNAALELCTLDNLHATKK